MLFRNCFRNRNKITISDLGHKESINYTRDHSVADSLNFIATWQAGMYQPKIWLAYLKHKQKGRARI
ncbi:MAG: hypothetical protein CM15mP49_17090 [Actinomycetota bacterium]|nr:MAG: hypothetical protein CM15mP49_17090 [Actinomycetota bacterium]